MFCRQCPGLGSGVQVLGAEIQPRAPLTLQSCRSLQAALFPPHSTAAPGGGGDPKLDPSSISHFSVLETTSTSRDAQIDTQAPWRWNSPGGSHCAPLSLQVGDAGGGGVGRVQGGGPGHRSLCLLGCLSEPGAHMHTYEHARAAGTVLSAWGLQAGGALMGHKERTWHICPVWHNASIPATPLQLGTGEWSGMMHQGLGGGTNLWSRAELHAGHCEPEGTVQGPAGTHGRQQQDSSLPGRPLGCREWCSPGLLLPSFLPGPDSFPARVGPGSQHCAQSTPRCSPAAELHAVGLCTLRGHGVCAAVPLPVPCSGITV